MLRTRVFTVVVLLPAVAAAVFLGGPWWAGLVALALTLAYIELDRLMGGGSAYGPTLIGIALVLDAYLPHLNLAPPALTFAILLGLSWQLFHRDQPAPATAWCVHLAGAVYLGWLGRHFVLLRNLPSGLLWLLMALLTTWITDTAAYFVGIHLGRHRMTPTLSPRKTWEGAVGGWVLGVAGATLVGALLGLGWTHGLAVGVLGSTAAPFGDLAVSMFKRQMGAKDTGKLLPGHGGMWDRADSLLFVGPVVYYYALWFGGP